MLFNSLAFAAFLPLVLGLYHCLNHRWQNRLLLLASYVFYGWWDERFLFLMMCSTAFDFLAGLVIERGKLTRAERIAPSLHLMLGAFLFLVLDWDAIRLDAEAPFLHIEAARLLAESSLGWKVLLGTTAASALIVFALPYAAALSDEKRRRLGMAMSLVGNLGLLGFFKYFDFFIGSAEEVVRSLGFDPEPLRLNLILPVGISFYTFQSLSYTIDIYRRQIPATSSFLDFALFVAYFPQLVAGPIERAAHLLPQIRNPRRWDWERSVQGGWLILLGLFKKVAIADSLAGSVESVYGAAAVVTWMDVIAATVLFAAQIYCDFSGYSDIARGTSRLFGIELMRNFRTPYFSTNPSDFWRRWHISLSQWLRDYLYIPLGGNRGSGAATYRNLMLTMLLGGLWHGAAWNFVLWGAFQGTLLCAHRALTGDTAARPRSALRTLVAMAGFFAITCYGWLLFRSTSLEQIGHFTGLLATDFGNLRMTMAKPTFAAMAGIPILLLVDFADYRMGMTSAYQQARPFLRGAVCAGIFFVFLMGTSNAPQQFIYFQF